LNDYYWFCLEHVRAYNAGWDFYKGMSPAEVEAQLRADTSWQRPTWPLGRGSSHGAWDDDMLRIRCMSSRPAGPTRPGARIRRSRRRNCANPWRRSACPGR